MKVWVIPLLTICCTVLLLVFIDLVGWVHPVKESIREIGELVYV